MCAILLVEDNDGCARALAARLKSDAASAGYNLRLDFAETLAEARERGRNYDGILLDLELPDSATLDTINALAWLAHNLPPIFIVTGYVDHARLALQAIQNGAEDFFDKGEFCSARNMALTRIVFGIARRNREGVAHERAA